MKNALQTSRRGLLDGQDEPQALPHGVAVLHRHQAEHVDSHVSAPAQQAQDLVDGSSFFVVPKHACCAGPAAGRRLAVAVGIAAVAVPGSRHLRPR